MTPSPDHLLTKIARETHVRTFRKNAVNPQNHETIINYDFKQLCLEPFVTQQEIIRTPEFILIGVGM